MCVCVICPVSVGTRMRSCFEKCGKTLELFPGELRKRLECFNRTCGVWISDVEEFSSVQLDSRYLKNTFQMFSLINTSEAPLNTSEAPTPTHYSSSPKTNSNSNSLKLPCLRNPWNSASHISRTIPVTSLATSLHLVHPLYSQSRDTNHVTLYFSILNWNAKQVYNEARYLLRDTLPLSQALPHSSPPDAFSRPIRAQDTSCSANQNTEYLLLAQSEHRIPPTYCHINQSYQIKTHVTESTNERGEVGARGGYFINQNLFYVTS